MTLSSFSDLDIEAYLAGKLKHEELDLFEEQMLFDEALQQRIVQLEALKQGLAANSAELLSAPKPSFWAQLLTMVATPAWSMSATALLVLVVASNLLNPDEVQAPAVFTDIVYAEQTRSAASEIKVYVPKGSVILSIDVLRFAGESVTVEWLEGSQATNARILLADYPVSDSGVLNLALPELKSSQATLNVISARQAMKILLQQQN